MDTYNPVADEDAPPSPAGSEPSVSAPDDPVQEQDAVFAAHDDPTPILDWRTISRLRQQRDATKSLLSEIEELEQHVDNLREKRRKEREQGKRKRPRTPISSSSDDSGEGSYRPDTPPIVVKKAKPRTARPARMAPAQGIPEHRQLAYIQLKRAIAGCLDRYPCTDRQRRAVLYDHATKITERITK